MQQSRYCEHFQNIKLTKKIDLAQELACKLCMVGKNYLWLCLAKNCESLLCDLNQMKHLTAHLEQSKVKKQFHSIFINVLTAKIICVHCHKEIYDLDQSKVGKNATTLADPYPLRLKILPYLAHLNSQKSKIIGQLQNPEGHKKISKALVGFFGNKHNYSFNSALQFLMQFELFRQIILTVKPFDKQIEQLANIFKKAEEADYRAIETNELFKLLAAQKPEIFGYSRKDPFADVLYFMNKTHDFIKYYRLDHYELDYDEWDALSNPAITEQPSIYCPLYDNTSIGLLVHYKCVDCNRKQSLPININYLKIPFPHKKRKAKEIQKQLTAHKFESPVKRRRKSLANLFQPEEECPFTLPQLIINFLKQPTHRDRLCNSCKQPLPKSKMEFESLPEYLIIQINRMGADGNSIDQTKLQFNTNDIDLGPLLANQDSIVKYKFVTAICIENQCSYPVIARSQFNNQLYTFKNQSVTMLKLQNPNPYVLCYKKIGKDEQKLKDCYGNLKSNVQVNILSSKQGVLLPDFWLCQLKNYISKPLHNQLICPHRKLKPEAESKMKNQQRVPNQVYDYLLELFQGKKPINQKCKQCEQKYNSIKKRKLEEKKKIVKYQKLKSHGYCIISQGWIKKWMNFLYNKGNSGYISYGSPMPGPIDNKFLVEGQKCKANLTKNVDFKVVNLYIWRFLKQLYGGGPQIRYKWTKGEIIQLQEQILLEIKNAVKEMKEIFTINYVISPRKNMILEKSTNFLESAKDSSEAQEHSIHQQIQ